MAYNQPKISVLRPEKITSYICPTYILNEDTQLVMRAIGVSHTACKDEFRRNLRSHSWSVFYFNFYNIVCTYVRLFRVLEANIV